MIIPFFFKRSRVHNDVSKSNNTAGSSGANTIPFQVDDEVNETAAFPRRLCCDGAESYYFVFDKS